MSRFFSKIVFGIFNFSRGAKSSARRDDGLEGSMEDTPRGTPDGARHIFSEESVGLDVEDYFPGLRQICAQSLFSEKFLRFARGLSRAEIYIKFSALASLTLTEDRIVVFVALLRSLYVFQYPPGILVESDLPAPTFTFVDEFEAIPGEFWQHWEAVYEEPAEDLQDLADEMMVGMIKKDS